MSTNTDTNSRVLVMGEAEQIELPQGFSEEFLVILTVFGWASARSYWVMNPGRQGADVPVLL